MFCGVSASEGKIMPVTHNFVSVISDAADTTLVRPSNWNDGHTVLLTAPTEVPIAVPAMIVAAVLNGAF
jgi:hypothetical protein